MCIKTDYFLSRKAINVIEKLQFNNIYSCSIQEGHKL